MPKPKLSVIIIGYGNTGRLICRGVLDHGGEVRAIVDRIAAGTASSGCDIPGGVPAFAEVRDLDSRVKADIAVISLGCDTSLIEEAAVFCLSRGINVITTSEQSFFPMDSDGDFSRKIDSLAKDNGCTFSASGFQDCYWVHSVACFASSLSRIDRICGRLRYNIEEYGANLAADHGVGLSMEEFRARFKDDAEDCYIVNSNAMLCEKLGWKALKHNVRYTPYVHYAPLYSAAAGRLIPVGRVIGLSAVVTTETQFGGVIETECTGKIYTDADKDVCSWSFKGEPSLSFNVAAPDTLRLTASSIVNRIPLVVAAEPGYITADKLPPCEYLTFPMEWYTL